MGPVAGITKEFWLLTQLKNQDKMLQTSRSRLQNEQAITSSQAQMKKFSQVQVKVLG